MLADTQLFFLWLLFSVVIFWILPPQKPLIRQVWVLSTSALYVFANAPNAFLLVLWMTCVACIGSFILSKKQNPGLLWLFIISALLPLLSHRTIYMDAALVSTLGVTFATLRAISIIIDSYSGVARHSTIVNFVYMFFLPLYTVGPVDKAKKFNLSAFSTKFDFVQLFRGFTRLCLGLFKNVVIAEQFFRSYLISTYPIANRDFSDFSIVDAFVFVVLSFLYTYINFSAFVDVAIGASKMFGFNIMENFKLPIFARNLQDFWKKWHISLGNWITNYLYMPIVFMIGKRYAPYAASFLAFSLIGWWHGSHVNYIAWGILHGIGLCVVQFWVKWIKKSQYSSVAKNDVYVFFSWACTIFFVAWVQTIANLKTVDDAVKLSKALVGL